MHCLADERGAAPPKTPDDVYGQGVRETPKLTPQQELAGFHLPDGFEAQLMASEPQISKPLNMAFDAKGQLWVTDTTEYPYPAPLNGPAHDTIKVLSDKDGDGRFETVRTFAEGLNIPIGILPVDDGVICFAIPNIMHLKDLDGDGKCDERKVLLGPFDTSRDTHGMINAIRRGPDGWIYACHGFNNQSHVKAADGSEVHLMSGNTFRFRADGSHVEQFTTGQVNPFGMTSDQWGNWYTADCHSKPVTMLVRGGFYESFGRPHDGLGFVPAVMDHLHGSTAICGISYYQAEHYPAAFRQKFYSGNVMTSRINCNRFQVDRDRIRLVEEPDFMTSDDPWFRPVDIQLGADGALYVADFYNKIIGHYEVRLDHPDRDRTSGRIWRIVYRGQDPSATPLGNIQVAPTKPLSAEHLEDLSSPNATRREFAGTALANSRLNSTEQTQLVDLVVDSGGEDDGMVVAALWTLHRYKSDTESLLNLALANASEVVRVAIFKAWADRPRLSDDKAKEVDRLRTIACQALASDTAQVALAAADALSVHGQADDVTALLTQVVKRTKETAIVPHAMRLAVKQLMQREDVASQVLAKLTAPQSSKNDQPQLLSLAAILPAVATPKAAQTLLALVSTGAPEFEAYRGAALQLACKQMRPEFAGPVISLLKSLETKNPSTEQILSANLDEQSSLALEALATLRSGQFKVPDELSSLLQTKLEQVASTIQLELNGQSDIKPIQWQATNNKAWLTEERKRAGSNQPYKVASSLTLGESYVGTRSSQSFVCPEKLSFWLCGHDGPPNMPAPTKNFVRLVHAESGKVLAQAAPPRDDVLQPVNWMLGEHAGQPVRVECVDGDNGTAYAWLGVEGFSLAGLNASRVDGAVAKLSKLVDSMGSMSWERSHSAIATIVASPALSDDERARLVSASAAARGRAVSKLLADVAITRGQTALVPALLVLTDDDKLPTANKELATLLASQLTLSQQTLLARGLIGSGPGRRLLIDLVEEGRMASQSLRSVKEVLVSAEADADTKRLHELSEAAAAAPSEAEQAIIARIAAFKPTAADSDKGKVIYEKNCANCHKLRGAGQLVGPQLDGVGPRGPERLAEDILLPNRNVDKAFRMTSILMEDDRVMVGLVRETANGELQLVGTDGKVQTVPRNEISIRKDTTRSLMPENFAELINDQDLSHLLRYITQ